MTGENRIVRQLRGVAARLTGDLELQKDLMQEMMIRLIQAQTEFPNHTMSWYVKNCEFHARNYLKHGRSIDSPKRMLANGAYDPPGTDEGKDSAGNHEIVDTVDAFGELVSEDLVQRILPHLKERQQRTLILLTKGFGVRETARELGISHVAVIKHRKKIARIARELLGDSEVADICNGGGGGATVCKGADQGHATTGASDLPPADTSGCCPVAKTEPTSARISVL